MANNDIKIKITIDSKDSVATLKSVEGGLERVGRVSRSARKNIDLVAHSFQALAGLQNLAGSLSSIATHGIEANRSFENLRTQLTGLIVANSSNISSLNQSLNAAQKWNLGLERSESILKALNKTNAKTKFSLTEITGAFNMLYATSAGQDGGLDRAAQAMDAIALAAQATGKDLNALTPMIDSLATGTVVAASEMGSFMKIVGLTNEELKRASGEGKVYDYIIEKLAKFRDMSEQAAGGFDVAVGNMQNEIEGLSRELSKPIFDALTRSIGGFSRLLSDNRTQILAWGGYLAQAARTAGILALALGGLKAAQMAYAVALSATSALTPIFASSLTASLTAAAALQRGLVALNGAFSALLPVATIYLIYESIEVIRALNDETGKVARGLGSVQAWLYSFFDAIGTQIQIGVTKIAQFGNEIEILGLKAKAFLNEYNPFSNEDSGAKIQRQIKLLEQYNKSYDELIKKYKTKSVDRELNLQGFETDGSGKILARETEKKAERLQEIAAQMGAGATAATQKSSQNIAKTLANQARYYEDYYEKIGDYAAAWAIKEKSLRAELKDAGINSADAQAKIREELEAQLRLQDRNFNIRQRAAALIIDEAEQRRYLNELEHERAELELNQLYQKGEITSEYYARALALEERLYQKQMFDASSWGQVLQNSLNGLSSAMGSFLDYSSDRFMKFGELAKDVLHQIYQALVKELIISQMISAIRGAIPEASSAPALSSNFASAGPSMGGGAMAGLVDSAKGNVFSSPDLHQYVNSVVSEPTFFQFAKGGIPNIGVMGEKNGGSPEAIMPLTRTASGDLGVKAVGSASNNIKIEVINQTKEDVKVTNVSSRQDLEEQVISIVINAARTNKGGMRDVLGGDR